MSLSETEMKIVDLYLKDNKSIREISSMYEGYGRTKIKNILEKYAQISEEKAREFELKKLSQKNHKELTNITEINLDDLTDEQIKQAYDDIIQGVKTLTLASSELGKNRDTLKNAIIEFLGEDADAVNEFNYILKLNQNSNRDKNLFSDMGLEEKKKYIFYRLNSRRMLRGKNPYSIDALERRYNRLCKYFQKRNNKIESSKDHINEVDLLNMIYESPTMLSMSLSDKMKPVIKLLDYKYLGFSKSSKLLKENSSILGTSLVRLGLQMKILKDSETLDIAMEKPRVFRTSPELMYALIESWKLRRDIPSPFITTKKVYERYSQTPEEFMKTFDVKQKYGDDEYFDRI